MSIEHWDGALEAAGGALGLGMWRLDFQSNAASWDETAAKLIQRVGPEPAELFIAWLEAAVGAEETLPVWSEDKRWVSAPLRLKGFEGPRYLRVAGQRNGRVWEGAIQDITHERMLRLRVAEAERLEVIGRFSAGIAHNFNNMLTIIVACLADAESRLAKQTLADKEVLGDIQDAQEAARRAAMVVGNLTKLTREDDNEKTGTYLVQALCTGALEGLRRVAVDNLEIVHSVPPALWVRQPPGMLEQVLGNLLANANYALKGHKSPTIWLRSSRSESFGVPTLELVVGDNGSGVPPEVEPHIFEPFVTSKGRDGTGLGLATAAESIRRLGGQLEYREREGGGAEFAIVVPLASAPTAPKETRKHPTTTQGDLAGCYVLVVDDEPVIRRLVKRILEQAGASVTTAGDLTAARRALSPPPDVVLLDGTLGRERGVELLPDLRAASSNTQVLFFSGDPMGPETELVDAVVPKPLDGPALVTAVSDVLTRVPGKGPRMRK